MKQDKIKMDVRGTNCEDVIWIQLPQDMAQWWAFVAGMMNHPAP
jgi:hypothetical protein